MHKKLFLLIISSLFLTSASFSQGGTPSVGAGTVIYKKEVVGGIIIHSSGWGANFRLSKHRTGKSRNVLGFSFVGMKHPKEYKSFNPYYEDSKGYIYGKQNSLFLLRPTFGQRRILFDKMRLRGIEVGYSWAIGPSIGFAKPVYLEIGHPGVPYDFITVEKYNSSEHFVDNIFGKASGTRGIGEIKIYPGLHSRFGFHFEYSGEKDGIKAIEVGAALDAFPKSVPIMADLEEVQNKQLFLSFYVNLLIGKKYFR